MTNTQLTDRLAALEISPVELSEIVRRPLAEVEGWLEAKTLPADAAILVRVLDDPHVARLAVQRVRTRQTRDLRGDGMVRSGIESIPHPGGFTGATGGAPQ